MAKRHDRQAMCGGKVRFASYAAAEDARLSHVRLFPGAEAQDAYACRFCGAVHLGTLSLKSVIRRGLATFPADAGEGREAHGLD